MFMNWFTVRIEQLLKQRGISLMLGYSQSKMSIQIFAQGEEKNDWKIHRILEVFFKDVK